MADDLYALRAKYRQQARQTEAEYSRQARDAVDRGFTTAINAPLEYVRQYIPRSENVMIDPPSVTGVNFSDPRQPIPKRDVTEGFNFAVDNAIDPLNLVGAGMFTGSAKALKEGYKKADNFFGEDASKGMLLSALSNYIDNWYGPANVTRPAKAIAATAKILKPNKYTDQEATALGAKVAGFTGWGFQGLQEVIETALSPKARALYKEKGITIGSQRHIARALADDAIHKAVAQVQYSSHIPQQAARVGNVAEEVSNIMEKSGVTDYFAYKRGGYAEAIREGGLVPTQNGRKTPIPDKDLNIIEDHFGTVWKAPDAKGAEVSFKDAPSPILMIKATGQGTRTGDHFTDLVNSGWITPVTKAFLDANKKPSVEDLWNALNKSKTTNLSKYSDTLEKAKENGIWITGSKRGRGYTEGGINYLINVKPNGNVIMVMSDEHNFFENLAKRADNFVRDKVPKAPETGLGLIRRLDEVLPNRLVAVTPPMQTNIFNLRSEKLGEAPAGNKQIKNVKARERGAVSREELQDVVNLKPSESALWLEQNINRQATRAVTSGGLLTENITRDREEK